MIEADPWCAECGTRTGPFVFERETEVCHPCHRFLTEAD